MACQRTLKDATNISPHKWFTEAPMQILPLHLPSPSMARPSPFKSIHQTNWTELKETNFHLTLSIDWLKLLPPSMVPGSRWSEEEMNTRVLTGNIFCPKLDRANGWSNKTKNHYTGSRWKVETGSELLGSNLPGPGASLLAKGSPIAPEVVCSRTVTRTTNDVYSKEQLRSFCQKKAKYWPNREFECEEQLYVMKRCTFSCDVKWSLKQKNGGE